MQVHLLGANYTQMLSTLESRNVPDYLVDLVVFEFVEYTVRADYYIVKGRSTFWFKNYIRCTYHTVLHTSERL